LDKANHSSDISVLVLLPNSVISRSRRRSTKPGLLSVRLGPTRVMSAVEQSGLTAVG